MINNLRLRTCIWSAAFLLASVGTAQTPELIFPATHYAGYLDRTPDGKRLISNGDGWIKIWDFQSGALLKNIFLEANSSGRVGETSIMVISPDSKTLAYRFKDELRLFDLTQFVETKKTTLPRDYEVMCFSTDSKYIFGAGHEKELYDDLFVEKMEVATLKPTTLEAWKVTTMATHSMGNIEVNPAGDRLLVSDGVLGGRLYDLTTGKRLKVFEKDDLPFGFLSNGNLIAFTGKNESAVFAAELDGKSFKSIRQSEKLFDNEYGVDPRNYTEIYRAGRDRMVFSYQNHYLLYDARQHTFNTIEPFTKPEFGTVSPANIWISPDAKEYVAGMNMTRYTLDENEFVQKYGLFSGNTAILNSMPHTNGIMLRTCTMEFGKSGFRFQRFPSPTSDDSGFLFRLSNDGKQGFIAVHGGGLYIFNPEITPYQYQRATTVPDKNWVALQVFDALNTVALICDEGVFLVDLLTLKLRSVIKNPTPEPYILLENATEKYVDISPDKSKLIFKSGGVSEDDLLYCYDLVAKKQLWKYRAHWMYNQKFTENGTKVVLTSTDDLITLDALTGKQIGARIQLPETDWWSYLSPDGKTIVSRLNNETNDGVGRDLGVFDVPAQRYVTTLKGLGYRTEGVAFLKDQRYVVAEEFGQLRIWDLLKSREVAVIQIFEETDDWIVMTRDGRFDASPGAMKKMYYSKGAEIIPLESLYENFYVPNLLGQVWENDLPKQGPDIKKLKSPPILNLIYKENKIRNLEVADDDAVPAFTSSVENDGFQLSATCADDDISEIRIFQNGKLIQNLTGLSGKSFSQAIAVTLSPGENRLRAIAINQQRTESRPAELMLTYTPPVKKTETGITLHLVVVGINAYKNPKYNLNYAEADAKAFADAIGKSCGRIVSSCKQHVVYNEKADKNAIAAELENVVRESKPTDVFVFYYAGHGVVAEDKTFYLVPHDVTQLYGNDGALAQKGLSAGELKGFSQKIKAQKQLFILDACQSSGALETVAVRGAAEEKAIAQLARSTGTHWFTAAGSEQFASEFAQLGHGVFTYALLEGLGGAADTGDQKITVKELDAYLQEHVPELTKKYKGTPQYPASFGFGNDFPISIK